MSQLTGAVTLELPLERLAQMVADLVVRQLDARGGGSEIYERPAEPDPTGAPDVTRGYPLGSGPARRAGGAS